MIKLCHIMTDTNTGGAGVLLLNQLKQLDRGIFDISVVLPENSELKGRIKALGCAVIESRHCADKSYERGAVPEYLKIIRKIKPDIVHCHGALSARVAAFLCAVPVRIYTRHCCFEPPAALMRFPLKHLCGAMNTILSNGIISVADSAADNLVAMGIPRKKITVIINGVEALEKYDEEEREWVRASLGFSSEDFVAGIFARLESCKGHSYLLRAVAEAIDAGADRMKILICGKGSLEDEIKREAGALGISKHIKFCGFVENITPYMNAVDLNVNCSVGTETSSLALSEGMSIGKAAVVSDYGGNPAMVEHGVSGIVVPKADSHALAKALLMLERDRALLERLSAAALERYRTHFCAEMMTDKLEKLYLSLYSKYAEKKREKLMLKLLRHRGQG